MWCFATRLRQAATGFAPANELHCDTLVRKRYERVCIEQFDGRPIERLSSESGLDERRLGRVFDYIEAHLAKPMTISDLAAVAACNPFHFARAFKVTVGFPPHAYLAIRRLEAARRLALRSAFPSNRSLKIPALSMFPISGGDFVGSLACFHRRCADPQFSKIGPSATAPRLFMFGHL